MQPATRRHRHRAARCIQELRRRAGIGGRRHPGFKPRRQGGWRRSRFREGGHKGSEQPFWGFPPCHAKAGHQRDQHGCAQGAGVSRRKPGGRARHAQPPKLRHRAVPMRLPQSLRHGVIPCGAIRQHGERAMRQARIAFQPPRCGIRRRRAQPLRSVIAQIAKCCGKTDQDQQMQSGRQGG